MDLKLQYEQIKYFSLHIIALVNNSNLIISFLYVSAVSFQ